MRCAFSHCGETKGSMAAPKAELASPPATANASASCRMAAKRDGAVDMGNLMQGTVASNPKGGIKYYSLI